MRAFLSVILFLLSSVLTLSLAHAQQDGSTGFETKAAQVLLVEASTGTVLLSKGETDTLVPGSIAKLMTLEIAFDAVARGEIALTTTYPVSEFAWRTGGAPSRTATMFAALKSEVPVMDLIRGIAIQTANDGCLILAEGMAGSEAAFVERMNKRATELGMTGTRFGNATGLPHPDNRTTLADMVLLARHMEATYPALYDVFKQPDFEWNEIFQRNRNPLLSMGADGLATGFSEENGFSIIASIERDGRRLFLGMSGLGSDKERADEASRVLEWGLSAFEMRRLFAAGEVIGEASVYGGAQGRVPLIAKADISVLVAIRNPDRLQARVVYDWPLRAPVAIDQPIGRLTVTAEDRQLLSVPLKSAAAVEVGTLRQRATDALIEALFFWL
ncbi:D-alanyl-D-alanine carboxypeptidase [Peteryoungia desertarenae]|uniref:serine-type D-Ala-D-Ala carboxypeptidase n=1 Tax=Peteryoungia desertarenae TaxID=1813451 RepID=A0ABX6QPE5_9HYPH|nr:D-alanyl-D-alanine carboxypeptidase family protein [Peteryoungia desertarenae]QLF70478.1 D-alanyl-D-alanine carboxypeptidase [Peteryoungia desertarenae]